MDTKEWAEIAEKKLLGLTVSEVRYLTKEEAEGMGWYEAPLVIFFNDGSHIFASADDEGNNGGALFTSFADQPVFPTIRI